MNILNSVEIVFMPGTILYTTIVIYDQEELIKGYIYSCGSKHISFDDFIFRECAKLTLVLQF